MYNTRGMTQSSNLISVSLVLPGRDLVSRVVLLLYAISKLYGTTNGLVQRFNNPSPAHRGLRYVVYISLDVDFGPPKKTPRITVKARVIIFNSLWTSLFNFRY